MVSIRYFVFYLNSGYADIMRVKNLVSIGPDEVIRLCMDVVTLDGSSSKMCEPRRFGTYYHKYSRYTTFPVTAHSTLFRT